MRFSVESWSPEYGTPYEVDGLEPSTATVDANVEVAIPDWRPLEPPSSAGAPTLVFVDGVRRIDARVWIVDADRARAGICASYAAGTVRCDGRARVEQCEVRRGVFSPVATAALDAGIARYEPRVAPGEETPNLLEALQQRLRELEVDVTRNAGPADLVVVDGPLRGRQDVPGAVGFIKTHRVEYLPLAAGQVVTELTAGQRTPLFVTQTSWSRYAWYARLPGPTDHPWAGIVRCEVSADLPLEEAQRLADLSTFELCRFASEPFKDPRAPQNLYPIGGLERELRRRLGDRELLYRALRRAAGARPA
jgi:hypothetical protein